MLPWQTRVPFTRKRLATKMAATIAGLTGPLRRPRGALDAGIEDGRPVKWRPRMNSRSAYPAAGGFGHRRLEPLSADTSIERERYDV